MLTMDDFKSPIGTGLMLRATNVRRCAPGASEARMRILNAAGDAMRGRTDPVCYGAAAEDGGAKRVQVFAGGSGAARPADGVIACRNSLDAWVEQKVNAMANEVRTRVRQVIPGQEFVISWELNIVAGAALLFGGSGPAARTAFMDAMAKWVAHARGLTYRVELDEKSKPGFVAVTVCF